LIIQDVKSEDRGKYEVIARNTAGVGSSTATLTVTFGPSIDENHQVDPNAFQKFELKTPESKVSEPVSTEPLQARIKIIEPLKDTYIVEGSQVVLNCKIDAYPKAEVRIIFFVNNLC
jgi:copper oxidase (laccase) domain-containing protein